MHLDRRVSAEHIDVLANVFGDMNPLHADPAAAKAAGFDRPIAHGAILLCFLSEIIGKQLGFTVPMHCGLQISFERPFYENDVLSFDIEPRHRSVALAATTYTFTVGRVGERVARGEFLVKELVPSPAEADRSEAAGQ